MALCSVADVRAKIYTSTLSDSDITNIINEVSEEVAELAGTTDQTNTALILAGKYAAYASVLRRMRNTGEAAARFKSGNSETQNTIDADIQAYDKKTEFYIKKYKSPSGSYAFGSGRMGFGTTNSELL